MRDAAGNCRRADVWRAYAKERCLHDWTDAVSEPNLNCRKMRETLAFERDYEAIHLKSTSWHCRKRALHISKTTSANIQLLRTRIVDFTSTCVTYLQNNFPHVRGFLRYVPFTQIFVTLLSMHWFADNLTKFGFLRPHAAPVRRVSVDCQII